MAIMSYMAGLGTTILYGTLLIAVIGGVIALVLFTKSFKYRVRIKDLVSDDKKVLFFDRARELKGKDGQLYWYLFKKKDKIQVPPKEAIEIDYKGRKFVDMYRTETGEYIPIHDNLKVAKLQPIDTPQRELYATRIEKAYARGQDSIWDKVLPLVPVVALVILAVFVIASWEEITSPMMEFGNSMVEISDKFEKGILTCKGVQYVEEGELPPS